MTHPPVADSAGLTLREAPDGMPDPDLRPPVIAESGDPFSALRVIAILARIQRAEPVRLDAIVDALNARHLDWIFGRSVVADAVLQLQANWMADYRNSGGIELSDGPCGPTVTIEDTSRVDPWIVRQADRLGRDCRERLEAFSRLDRVTGDG